MSTSTIAMKMKACAIVGSGVADVERARDLLVGHEAH